MKKAKRQDKVEAYGNMHAVRDNDTGQVKRVFHSKEEAETLDSLLTVLASNPKTKP